jgi:D-glycero-D-manno-heptose 1,7-bisphosphate phosphatase
MNKAAFLDRDGVINRKARKGEYILGWKEVEFLPGVVEALRLLKQAGYSVVVITNQRCVAKGLISIPVLESMHQRMREELGRAGAVIDAIYYCPHEEQLACGCRKPAPGMLFQASRDHAIDLAASWMIGDSDIDVEAGRNAGCMTARLLENGETSQRPADVVASSLLDAVRQILRQEVSPDLPLDQSAHNSEDERR